MEQTQELLQKCDARARNLRPRMEIAGEGLMPGAKSVLAKTVRRKTGMPGLEVEDEQRIFALLATAYGRPVEASVLTEIRRACERWNAGEKALAHIHLAHAAACRPAAKIRPCACSWRTNSSKPVSHQKPC